jgi:hypothetical protein
MNTWYNHGMDPDAAATILVAEGWLAISNKYQLVARLPEGMTGKEALFEEEMGLACPPRHMAPYWAAEVRRWVDALEEEESRSYFCRVHAPQHKSLHRALDVETWKAFKRLGGRTA